MNLGENGLCVGLGMNRVPQSGRRRMCLLHAQFGVSIFLAYVTTSYQLLSTRSHKHDSFGGGVGGGGGGVL